MAAFSVAGVAGVSGPLATALSRVYAHWLRYDRNVPAAVLDRVLAPVAAQDRVSG